LLLGHPVGDNLLKFASLCPLPILALVEHCLQFVCGILCTG
jgi:hypothetical protein